MVDQLLADEVVLTAINTEAQYRHHQAIVANLQRKRRRGVYDANLALKLWGQAVMGAIKHYRREVGPLGRINLATKWEMAKQLAEYYDEEVMGGAEG